MAPPSQELEPPINPGRFTDGRKPFFNLKALKSQLIDLISKGRASDSLIPFALYAQFFGIFGFLLLILGHDPALPKVRL